MILKADVFLQGVLVGMRLHVACLPLFDAPRSSGFEDVLLGIAARSDAGLSVPHFTSR